MTFPRPSAAFALALGLLVSLVAPANAPGAPADIIQYASAAREMVATLAPRLVRVEAGDTLMGLLVDAGVAMADAQEAIDALRPVWNPRALKIGQEIALQFATARLQELRVAAAIDRDVIVARATDGHFSSRAQTHPLTHAPQLAAGIIRTNLFEAATDAGVPMPVLAEMIRAFSYDVDFQREIQPEDSFEVLFERLYDENGKMVGTGDIAYASMTLSGKVLRLYGYTPAGTTVADFFNEQGQSVKKALLRTPVDGARLSSGFGMRHHPILGYTMMHRGVDFAVPPGTPIMAAGDGTVETASFSGSYGNLVVLRHNGIYETAYAHMSHFARGLKSGQHVRQGDVIGYVGATGRATGPHLHYEVRLQGEPANPMSVKMQPGPLLAGNELTTFHRLLDGIDHKLLALRQQSIVAAMPTRQPE